MDKNKTDATELGSAAWFEGIEEIPLDEPKPKVEPIQRHLIDDILRDCVCSTCWGPLDFKYSNGKWYVLCRNCKEETVGYASKHFAEHRRDESERELLEARRNLAEIFGVKTEKHSREDNLKALGF